MIVYFGLALDESAHPQIKENTGGLQYLGPQKFLQLLEAHLGLSGDANNNEYLRIEQYRQALIIHQKNATQPFYGASFQADPFATSQELLERRDQLLLAGWNFEQSTPIPVRLKTMAEIEAIFVKEEQLELVAGYADRIHRIILALPKKDVPIDQLILCEPPELLPNAVRKIVGLLEQKGTKIKILESQSSLDDSDLGLLKKNMLSEQAPQKMSLKADGSLLILRGKRETELAAFSAALLRLNADFSPACLISDKSRALDNALIQEGLPGMGILSASLARPSLQVLKLVPTFLWNPINPYKILEFASLSVKPLHQELAARIAQLMAQSPGIGSESWEIMIKRFFEDLKIKAEQDKKLDYNEIEKQYHFWFKRKRYDISAVVPKKDVIEIFDYLKKWAYDAYEESGNTNNSFLVLSSQSDRIKDLLETLPETQLTNLQLERVVRTIYEPAPLEMHPKELGCLAHIHQPNALIGEIDDLIWWNFVQNEQDHFFSKWYKQELAWLEEKGLQIEGPDQQNALLIWQRKRPILYTRKRLLLIIPDKINGSEAHPHTLYGDLEAMFDNLEAISFAIDNPTDLTRLGHWFDLPQMEQLNKAQLGQPKPIIKIKEPHRLEQRDYETLTSLESLFYYTYQWVFRYQIKLQKSSILSVVPDNTLMGNLAHRFFERLLQQDGVQNWEKEQLYSWIDKESKSLLQREGATLMLYGREPERIGFLQRIKFSAWSMINLIRNNNWSIAATEKPLEGHFLEVPLNARADLVLQRENERVVVDLKWRGASRRERIIRNEEDLQLVLYAHLMNDEQQWAHTAYFIMENGKMIARNNQAFTEIIPVSPDSDHAEVNERILDNMKATYLWRMKQIQSGQIEVRCQHTLQELEELYEGELMDILEMKNQDAPFDDYRTLINLIE